MKVPILMIALMTTLMIGCSPSCEDRGGKLEFVRFQPIIQVINKTIIVQQIPVYECKGAIEDEYYDN